MVKSAEQLDERRLARAVQPDKSQLFAGFHREAEIPDREILRAVVTE